MTGSVIDGEDVLQEAIVKAIEAFDEAGPVTNPEGWLFRIAHNAALDHLRRRVRQDALRSDEDPDTMTDQTSADHRETAAASLRTFMRLPVAQRSSVILRDVLGYSLEEIGDVTGTTIPAIKASLHRGRARLRELAQEPDDIPLPALAEPERSLLAAYVDRFNARDFDAVRDMLADEVRLELVNRLRISGRSEVGRYFTNYSRLEGWHVVAGLVDRRPAVLFLNVADPAGAPAYFVLIEHLSGKVSSIRDFRHAAYVMESAEVIALE
jgi:RNA polymerase sigma-70 factor (ECF subfamily)